MKKIWRHTEGEDILDQVAKASDAIKRQAALVLLKNGITPRAIRKKLNMSDRQLKLVQRLHKQAVNINLEDLFQ
jgi:hypothetical protein